MPTQTIAAAVVFGVLGLIIGWLWSHREAGAEKQRADRLGEDLKQRADALTAAETSLKQESEGRRFDQSAHNEQDKRQAAEIASLKAQLDAADKNVEKTAGYLEEVRAENARVRGELSQTQTNLAALRTSLESERKSAEEKLALLTSARDELSHQFKALAGDILKENSKAFTEQNQTNIGNLLNPLQTKFSEFQQEVKKLNDSGIAGRTELKTQIDNLAKLNTRLSDEASNLTTALKGSSKTQGDWGEVLLESILESAGLRKGIEYLTQESFLRDQPAADGHLRARLDVLVRLPEERDLIIDSKVSLNAYRGCCAATDDATRQAKLKEHLKSVRDHINGLAKRDYQLLPGINPPDFVVMFVPIEPAFMLAISNDNKLWQEAWDRNVLMVSPSTLLFVLRTVAQLWRQETQTKQVQEIVKRGALLYDKLVAFTAELTGVGKGLSVAKASYDEAVRKFSIEKGNVIGQAEKLKGLGVKPKKFLPLALVKCSEEQEPIELAAAEEPQTVPASEADSPSA